MRPLLRLCVVLSAFALGACGKSESPPAAPSPAAAGAAGAPSGSPSGAPAVPGAKTLQPRPDLSLAALESAPAQGACTVENVVALPAQTPQAAVNNTYTAATGSTVKFIGFATRKDDGEPLKRFTLLLAASQAYAVAAETTLERPDVVSFFKKPGLLVSGFQVDVSLQGLPPGEYVFYMRRDDGPVCPTHQKLKVTA